jgi:hypothetical protein
MDFYKQYDSDILTQAMGDPEDNWGSQVARQGYQPYASAAFSPKEIFLVFISVRGWVKRIMSMKNSTVGNRNRDFPTCCKVPQPTALQRAPAVCV